MTPWRWHGRRSRQHSKWLQSTLSELEEKKAAMLALIQEDRGESFAPQPEFSDDRKQKLVKMVEDFYLSYRSLAEIYNQLKLEPMPTALSSSLASSNSMKPLLDLQSCTKRDKERDDDSKPEQPNSNPESVVEDPDTEFSSKSMDGPTLVEADIQHLNLNEIQIQGFHHPNIKHGKEIIGYEMANRKFNHFKLNNFPGGMTTGIQVSALLEENLRHQAELIKRNDEKREIIKDLTVQLQRAMEENRALEGKCTGCSRIVTKQNSQSHVSRLKGLFIGKLWGGGSA